MYPTPSLTTPPTSLTSHPTPRLCESNSSPTRTPTKKKSSAASRFSTPTGTCPSRTSTSTPANPPAQPAPYNAAAPASVVQYSPGAIMANYTQAHARAGIDAKLPPLETWPNQFPGYIITTKFPEYSSVCPKTGLPDFGTITIQHIPRQDCIALKAPTLYLLAYRDLGIFYDNAVTRVLPYIT